MYAIPVSAPTTYRPWRNYGYLPPPSRRTKPVRAGVNWAFAPHEKPVHSGLGPVVPPALSFDDASTNVFTPPEIKTARSDATHDRLGLLPAPPQSLCETRVEAPLEAQPRIEPRAYPRIEPHAYPRVQPRARPISPVWITVTTALASVCVSMAFALVVL